MTSYVKPDSELSQFFHQEPFSGLFCHLPERICWEGGSKAVQVLYKKSKRTHDGANIVLDLLGQPPKA